MSQAETKDMARANRTQPTTPKCWIAGVTGEMARMKPSGPKMARVRADILISLLWEFPGRDHPPGQDVG